MVAKSRKEGKRLDDRYLHRLRAALLSDNLRKPGNSADGKHSLTAGSWGWGLLPGARLHLFSVLPPDPVSAPLRAKPECKDAADFCKVRRGSIFPLLFPDTSQLHGRSSAAPPKGRGK